MSLQIHPVSFYDLEKIRFGKVIPINPNLKKISLKYDGEPVMIRGPRMTLGTDIVIVADTYYIDLVFDQTKWCQRLFNFVKGFDTLVMAEAYDHSNGLYGSDQTPLIQIEHEYLPSIRSSVIYQDRQSLKLKIPINDVEFYDQDNVVIPYQLIKEDYTVIPLLMLSEVFKDSSHLWTNWKLPQLKVELPETFLKGCQLADETAPVDETDEVDDTPVDEDADVKEISSRENERTSDAIVEEKPTIVDVVEKTDTVVDVVEKTDVVAEEKKTNIDEVKIAT